MTDFGANKYRPRMLDSMLEKSGLTYLHLTGLL